MKALLVGLLVVVTGAFGAGWTKVGLDNTFVYTTDPTSNGEYRMPEDWEWNSGGAIDTTPTTGGSWDGWGSYFITTVLQDTGEDIQLTEFGFPCNYGDGSGPGDNVEWVVWYDVGGINPPSGDYTSWDVMGHFDPEDTSGNFPPTVYTYIDVSGEDIIIEDGWYLCFGYQNPGYGGQISFNGTQTWAWYSGYWDPDENWGRTAILQVKGNIALVDENPPTITNTYPHDEDYPSGVPIDTWTGCHWEDGDPAENRGIDVDASTFELFDSNMDPVDGTLTIDDTDLFDVVVDFEPDGDLTEGETYTVDTVTYDKAGNGPVEETWTFTTGYVSIAPASLGTIKAGYAR